MSGNGGRERTIFNGIARLKIIASFCLERGSRCGTGRDCRGEGRLNLNRLHWCRPSWNRSDSRLVNGAVDFLRKAGRADADQGGKGEGNRRKGSDAIRKRHESD
nr:hypothetical protein [Sphingomonas sp. HMP6]